MPEAKIAQAVQLLDLMLEHFADDGHWTRVWAFAGPAISGAREFPRAKATPPRRSALNKGFGVQARRDAQIQGRRRAEFAPDSALEQSGFEPLVPLTWMSASHRGTAA